MNINRTLKIFTVIFLTLTILGLSQPARTQASRTFTPLELAQYNGQNGKPAYVGLNGLVYDLSGLYAWDQGRHYCPEALAGTDITAIWKKAPAYHRDDGFLKLYPVVGKLAPATPPQPTATPGVTPGKKTVATPKPK
jgi:predicted heme/steroid binding protein